MIVRDPRTVSGLNDQQIKQSIDPYSQQFMDGIVDGPVGKAWLEISERFPYFPTGPTKKDSPPF